MPEERTPLSRRSFLQTLGLLGVGGLGGSAFLTSCQSKMSDDLIAEATGTPSFIVDDFNRPDSVNAGDMWESMNPGYWGIESGALRRRLHHPGDERPTDWFPWHWETHRAEDIPVEYDPSLPPGMIWRRDWYMRGNFSIQIDFTIKGLPDYGAVSEQAQYERGYGYLGLCFGSKCLHESWEFKDESGRGSAIRRLLKNESSDEGAWMALLTDDKRFGVFSHAQGANEPVSGSSEQTAPSLNAGDEGSIAIFITGENEETAIVTALLVLGNKWSNVQINRVNRKQFIEGYFGVVTRGLIDAEINRVALHPLGNEALATPVNELYVGYALGDSLREENGHWNCTFVNLFRNEGTEAEIRIAREESPLGGWEAVPVAGKAPIVTNDFRRNTAVIQARLPVPPADATLYYTIWKDGVNVTPDPRIGSASTGPGTGFTGQVPESGSYVGRLPQLTAPYKVCGLSCHAIHANRPALPNAGTYQEWFVHDQPDPKAFQHLDAFDFQVMLWEDDVWYLELMFPPPSADDSYKVITTTIAGPTSRWQMMRHWNVINPGDHDYGMDDVKGPEQYILRHQDGLGQDPAYLRRNFQIVHHLMRGDERPDPTVNPKVWRKWRMPNKDFSLYVLDARLWRTSQDTRIWDDEGWGDSENIYSRTNPTRTLLGEEQFAWLQQHIRTDASPLLLLTGINGLHTIWSGVEEDAVTGQRFSERDRVTADYAGWVSAGSDRVIELLGSREGITSVYGDVHNGSLVYNKDHRFWECSFGPIGRGSGRRPKEDFGPDMVDYDGRAIRVNALYHADYHSPTLAKADGPFYWNFLEMAFDPRAAEPAIRLTIRNILDAPSDPPRGGSGVLQQASSTGRIPTSKVPSIQTLASADVQISTLDGAPIRSTRTRSNGRLISPLLTGIPPGTSLLLTAYTTEHAEAKLIQTIPV